MYENAKLAEAKYFYSQMSANFEDREKFTHNLSAFLSSARSVLQYALEEAKTKNGGQAWYDTQVAADSILPFFKDKRDVNIHTQPVRPIKNISAVINETIRLSDSISVVVRDANGNIKYESSGESPTHKTKPQPLPSSVTFRYSFPDWVGEADVMGLCQRYIASLEMFVMNGTDNGFLTG